MEGYNVAIRIRIYRFDFLLFHHEFMRLTPSTPRMVNPPYWKVFAKPKNTNHNTPFAAAEMGYDLICQAVAQRILFPSNPLQKSIKFPDTYEFHQGFDQGMHFCVAWFRIPTF